MPAVEHFSLPITNTLSYGDLDEWLLTGEIQLAVGPLVFIVETDLAEIHGSGVLRSEGESTQNALSNTPPSSKRFCPVM